MIFRIFLGFMCTCTCYGQMLTAPPAAPTPYVRFDMWNGTGSPCNGLHTRTLYQVSGVPSSISLGLCEQYVLVSTSMNGGQVHPDIGRIELSGGRSGAVGPIQLQFVASAPATNLSPAQIPPGTSTPPYIGNNLLGVETYTSNPTAFYGAVRGGLVGPIVVQELAQFRALGDVVSPITALNYYTSNGVAIIEGANISGNCTMTGGTSASRFTRIFATAGTLSGSINAYRVDFARAFENILGNINATDRIVRVEAAGSIGLANGSTQIQAGGVNQIVAGGSVRATITASVNATDFVNSLQLLTCSTFSGSIDVGRIENTTAGVNAVDIAGDVTGTLRVRGQTRSPLRFRGDVPAGSITLGNSATDTVWQPIVIDGKLAAPVSLSAFEGNQGLMTVGEVEPGGSITVGESLTRSVSVTGPMAGTIAINKSLTTIGKIEMPPNGLVGQIIINASGSPSGDVPITQVWNDAAANGIRVDMTRIVPTSPTNGRYTDSSASLGGGAVGYVGLDGQQVGYQLHRGDLTPASLRNSAPVLSRGEAEGPFCLFHYGPVQLIGSPIKVERRAADDSGAWTDQSSCFSVTEGASPREIVVSLLPDKKLQAGFDYRIVLAGTQSDRLKSLGLAPGIERDVVPYSVEFHVCSTDMHPGDADDDGTVTFTDVTTVLANFGNPQCLQQGDADRDGTVAFADITTVLANMNTGYPCSIGDELGGGGLCASDHGGRSADFC